MSVAPISGSSAPPIGSEVSEHLRSRLREMEQQGYVLPANVRQEILNAADAIDKQQGPNADVTMPAVVNSGASGVSPPHENTDRSRELSGQHTYTKELTPEQWEVAQAIQNAPTPEDAEALKRAHGVWTAPDGTIYFPRAEPAAGNVRNSAPGMSAEQAGVTQAASDMVQRSSPWIIAGSVASGLGFNNVGTLIGSTVMGGAIGTMSNLPNPRGPGGYAVATAGWSAIATMAEAGDYPGLADGARQIMHSYSRERKIDSMINIIDSNAYSIEDLIFLFMAQVQDQMEERLRDKMREQQIAEKLEERRNRIEKMASMEAGMVRAGGSSVSGISSTIGGLVGLVVPAAGAIINGAGEVAKGVAEQRANFIEMQAQREIEQQAAMNGNMKSSTALASEVQMLLHKWKQLQELMSNLLKAMHDMTMTPIRNLR